jgi:dUTP pyrophosphatase
MMLEIPVVALDPDLPLPSYARTGDAGADLVARTAAVLAPGGGRELIPTGIAIAIPEGFAGFVQPRSGLALRHGVTVLNSPGLIDAGYRDEVRVILVNLDPVTPYEVRRGDRIAQLVIMPVEGARFAVTEALSASVRGQGGFGHTGV